MFWWLLTPFVGEDLGKVTAELETKLTDNVVQRCAKLAFDNEQRAARGAHEATKDLFRSGMYGSTIPDMIKIHELEQQLAFARGMVSDYQLIFSKMVWLSDQEQR